MNTTDGHFSADKEMAISRLSSPLLQPDPNDIPHHMNLVLWQGRVEWRRVSAIYCRWRCYRWADQVLNLTQEKKRERLENWDKSSHNRFLLLTREQLDTEHETDLADLPQPTTIKYWTSL